MKMIAISTVHGRRLIAAADAKNPRSRAKYQDVLVKPGEEFDTEELGIGDGEAQDLVARKVAKRKVREVPDDGDAAVQQPAA